MSLHVVATIPLDPERAAEAGPALAELAASSRGDTLGSRSLSV